MKPHQEYKDSGVEWCPSIPSHWDVLKTKFLFKQVSIRDSADEELLSIYRDYGVVPRYSRDDNFNRPAEDLTNYKLVRKGFLVINKMKAWQGSIALSDLQGIVSPAYITCEPTANFYGRYFHYLYRSQLYIQEWNRLSQGIRPSQWDLSYEDFSQTPAFFPPLSEQQAIADFLDCKTAQVDMLIEKKQRQIDLLQEQRTALINHAVMKGLNPNVPMKDSGVEWFEEIPSDWKVLPLKRVVQKFVDYRGHTPVKTDSGVLLITARNIRDGKLDFETSKEYIAVDNYDSWMVRGLPEKGDVMVTTEAPLGATAQIEEEYVALAQRLILLKTDKSQMDNTFLKYYFLSQAGQHELYSQATGSTALGIKASKFYNINIVIPPLKEQQKIVEYLTGEETRILSLKKRIEEIIGLLREYRTALISEAVTGKVDVRGWKTVHE